MKNGFLRYSILRGKSEKPDRKLEGKIGQVMEVHMDANVVRSQLRYRPIFRVPLRQALKYYTTIWTLVKTLFKKIKCY